MSALRIAVCCAAICISLIRADSHYDSSYAFVNVENSVSKQQERFCVNYEQFKTGLLPTTAQDAIPVKLVWWANQDENTNVCKNEARADLSGSVVPLNYRLDNNSGICAKAPPSWKDALQYQVDQLLMHNVSTGLFLVRRGQQFFTKWHDYLFSEFSDPDLNHSSIPIFFTYNDTLFDKMLMLSSPGQDGKDLEMRFYRPSSHVFDLSMVIIWVLAVFSITMGGYWSGERKIALELEERKYLAEQQRPPTAVDSQSSIIGATAIDDLDSIGDAEQLSRPIRVKQPQPPQPASTPVNCCFVIVMLVVVVGVLMLGYYFRIVMVYIFNILLVIGGTFAVFGCLAALVGPIPCGRCRVCKSINDITQSVFKREVFHWDCCHKRPMWRSICLFLLSASITVAWFIIRQNAYAFILLDFINVCLCIHVIKGLRFPSLKWLVMLLAVMFVYDMFMVFGTPYITSDGCSIMVQVAVGSDCTPAPVGQYPVAPIDSQIPEILPMLFRVPRLSDPMLTCVDLSVELQYRPIMLGLGDIIMPGFLVGYCFGVDLTKKKGFVYGPVSVLSYGAGLIVTFIALTLMKIAQPALIYLVPCTLVPVCLVALCRKEFLQLWHGVESADAPETTAVLDSVPSGAGISHHGTINQLAENGNTIH